MSSYKIVKCLVPRMNPVTFNEFTVKDFLLYKRND